MGPVRPSVSSARDARSRCCSTAWYGTPSLRTALVRFLQHSFPNEMLKPIAQNHSGQRFWQMRWPVGPRSMFRPVRELIILSVSPFNTFGDLLASGVAWYLIVQPIGRAITFFAFMLCNDYVECLLDRPAPCSAKCILCSILMPSAGFGGSAPMIDDVCCLLSSGIQGGFDEKD